MVCLIPPFPPPLHVKVSSYKSQFWKYLANHWEKIFYNDDTIINYLTSLLGVMILVKISELNSVL